MDKDIEAQKNMINERIGIQLEKLLFQVSAGDVSIEDLIVQSCTNMIALIILEVDPVEIVTISSNIADIILADMYDSITDLKDI